MSDYDALIIGAGSAGLMCASRLCFYAKKSSNNIKVGLIDSNNKIGRKLAITGNGRCNLTNTILDSSKYNSDNKSSVDAIISSFNVSDTLDYFEHELGLITTCKDNLVYPITLKSSSVIDCFKSYLEDNEVEFIYDTKVTSILKHDNVFEVKTSGKVLTSKNVIVATGGCSYRNTGSDGSGYRLLSGFVNKSNFSPVRPSLIQLVSNDKSLSMLSGIRMPANVELFSEDQLIHSERGELLFTDNGISGICVMQLSRFVSNGKYVVVADLMPDFSENIVNNRITELISDFSNRRVTDSLAGLLLKPVTEVILKKMNISSDTLAKDLPSGSALRIAKHIKEFRITISGTEDFDKAQVTTGGLNLNSMNEYLEVKSVSGLYACGEVLNVDGPCGGYNLQWAWSSADSVARGIVRGFNEVRV